MSKKFSLEEVKQEFINRGYIPLFDDYQNNKEKLSAKTKEGYIIQISLSNLKQNYEPQVFDIYNSYTIENIKLWCKLSNKPFELISNEYCGNKKHLYWKCLKENCGEIFESSWDSIYADHECSYCNGKKAGISNCLITKNYKLAQEWHPTKNGNLTPYDVLPNSHKKVWWLCGRCGFEWKTAISNRNSGNNGCPKHTNEKISISLSIPSEKNNLLLINPKLCEEWNYIRNDKGPENYCVGSTKKVWWICKEGHQWEAIINNRSKNNCPYCLNKKVCIDNCLATVNPILAQEWNHIKNNDLTSYDVLPNSNKKVWWKCKICNHEWEAMIGSRNNSGNGCPKCNESKGEKRIECYLVQHNIKYKTQYKFDMCRNVRVLPFDFYLIDYNICIEYDGALHYIEKDHFGGNVTLKKTQHNDYIKTNYCLTNNIILLRIPYWRFNNIEIILDDFLLDKMIKH